MRRSWQTPGRLRIFILSFLFIEAFFLVGASSGEAKPLPVRRIEKQATRQEDPATQVRTKGVAVSPSTPRPTISKTGIAPQIVALAESLNRSPSQIFRFVHDSIDFDPKWGAVKPPLGTLWERTGTPWDQAWLLRDLLSAAGVDARFEWGEVEITPETLTNLTGVDDPLRAGDLLTTAGVPIVLVVSGSRVVAARMSHVWVKAYVDYIPNRGVRPGPGDKWIRMDPSLNRFDVGGGVRLDEDVPFDLGEYLRSGTLLSPRAFYEEALQAYADTNNLGVAGLEEVKPRKSLIAENFPFVPGTLRAAVLSVAGEASEVPVEFQHQLEVKVRETGGTVLLTWSTALPAVYGKRVELAWPGATSADQATLDLNGGVFATPPFEVDLRPSLRVDAAEVASGEPVGSAEDVELAATLTPPHGSPAVALFEMFAGEHAVLASDLGQIPQETVERYTQERDSATEADEIEAWSLALGGAVYLRALGGDLEHLSALRYRRLVRLGNVVLAVQRGAVSYAADGTPLTFSAAPPSLDLGSMVLGLFPADGAVGSPSSSVSTLELLGSQGSAQEGEALTQAFGGDHLTAVGFLTRAAREGQTLTHLDATNLDAALAAAELSADAEVSVRAAIDRVLIAWIPESQLPFDTWDTTGYVLEDPATGAGGYFVTFERPVQGLEANVVFHSPQDLDEVTAPTGVAATLEGEEIDSWTLAYRPAAGGPAVTLASGTGAFSNTVLAELDPTLLMNGLYDVVLTARDARGQSASEKISVVVEGGMKAGNFTLSLVDLAIPLSGLDLELVRTYDSRARRPGDFGFGWTLEIRQGSYRNNRTPGLGWQVAAGLLPCQAAVELRSHLTLVRLSDEEVYRFRLRLGEPSATFGGCFAEARFDFVDGPSPGATLEILGNTAVLYQNGTDFVVDRETFDVFEPGQVRLTTRDGRIFDLDLDDGVTRLEDTNGNELRITPTGFTHSSGKGLEILRDDEGRITRVTDPMGFEIGYAYDAQGDLVAVTDQEGGVARYGYDERHFLVEIEDPLGRQAVRNEYDEDGRLIRVTDALGKSIELAHDVAGRRTVRTDRLGNVLVHEYDERGNVVREVNGNGEETRRTFDGDDRLLSETDALGNTMAFEYDAYGDLVTETDALGNKVRFTYDASGRRLTVRDSLGNTTALAYDERGNLTSVTDALGNETRKEFDAAGNRMKIVDPLGGEHMFAYDAFGHLLSETDALGNTSSFTYDDNGRMLTHAVIRTTPSGPELVTTSSSYDTLGRVTGRIGPDGATASFTYDVADNLTRTTDPLGRVTSFERDSLDRLTRTANPDGTVSRWAYDAEGRVVQRVDTAGRASAMSFDSVGRLTRLERPDTLATENRFDAAGRLIESQDARGNVTRSEYDAPGRLTRQLDALGNASRVTFDAAGREVTSVDALGRTTGREFDAVGRLTRVRNRDASETSAEYDALGRVTRIVDEMGRATSYGHDAIGRLVSVTTADGLAHRFAYDEQDRLTAVTDASDHATHLEYDRLGRLVRRVLPDGSAQGFSYDVIGRLTATTSFSGQTVSLTYGADGRLARKQLPDGSAVTWTYTANGQMASVTDGRGTTTFAYDVLDRLVGLTYPDGRSLSYGYDVDDNLAQLTITLGPTVLTTAFSYDAVNQLETVTDPEGGVYRYTYDAVGMPRTLSYPNGVTVEYVYDARDRLTALTTRASDGSVLDSYALTLDLAGHRTRIVETGATTLDYAFDDVYRLVGETATGGTGTLLHRRSFSYDAAGNRARQTVEEGGSARTVSYEYDNRDRLLSGEGSFTWDAEGNLLSRTGARAADYTWDVESRLRRVTLADGTRVDHSYDSEGVRVRTEVVDPGGTTEVRNLLVDPGQVLSQVVAVTDANGDQVEYYVRGLGLLAIVRPSGTRYAHTDGSGSTRALTDETGTVTDRYRYSAFGELLEHVGEDPQPYLYGGERLEPASGLYDLRARWMDPEVGRFLSRDPFPVNVRQPASIHRYVYAGNDPVDLGDPTGFSPVHAILKIIGFGQLQIKDEVRQSRSLYPLDVRLRPMRVILAGWLDAAIEHSLNLAKEVYSRQAGLILHWDSVEELPQTPGRFGVQAARSKFVELAKESRGQIPVIFAMHIKPDTQVPELESLLGGYGVSPPDLPAQGVVVFRFKKWPDSTRWYYTPPKVAAHELAHALGLRGHVPDPTNLVCGFSGEPDFDPVHDVSPCRGEGGTLLNNGQVLQMRWGAIGVFPHARGANP